MFVDDLFDKKSLTEAQGGGSPWHSEPEQQQMDADRRGRLGRERNAGLDEPDDAASGSVQTGNGVYEYTVPAGQESTAQELGLQQHRGHWFSRVPIQRANFQFGQPQFREIPSQGVAEGSEDLASLRAKANEISNRIDAIVKDGGRVGFNDPLSRQLKAIRSKIQQAKKKGVAEGDSDWSGSQSRFAGDVPVDLGGAVVKRLDVDDTVSYFGEKATILAMSKDRTVSRISLKSGITQNVKTSDLKRVGQGVGEGMMDNPGQEDSPVAQAIIRRILLQRTDLLAKHGPEKVGQAVDEVADFVGDVDEIGSSDVSGWVRHVEQMLGNMQEDVAESKQVNELFGFGQDLEKQIAKKEDELKSLKAKLAAKTTTNAGIQTGATALVDPDTGHPYEKDKLAAMYGYKEPVAEPVDTSTEPVAQTPAQIRAEKQKAAAAIAQGQMAGKVPAPVAQTPAATTAVTTTNPAGFNAGNVMKLPGMEKYAKPAPTPKTTNFGAGPTGYAKTTTSIKPPAAPSSPALAVPGAPKVPRVTSGGPTPAEKANLEKRLAAAAPAVAETMRQIDRMLESVTSKKSAEIIKAYADQRFTELGLRNTTECKQIMAHVVHESAVRRRAYAQRMAK
mgnify:CR=1 FL=1